MVGRSVAGRVAAWIGALFLSPITGLQAAGDWQLPEASLRYKVTLGRKPTHPSAGYFVQLPDGGLLRGAVPATVVMSEDGKVIPSYLLWHNAESGFSIVFADPGKTREVHVYFQYGRPPQLWKPDSGLTPSALLCTAPGRDSLGAAQALGKLGRVETATHIENKAGIPKAPLSIGGDDTGRPRPASFYQLSYVEATDAGKFWVSPFIRSGVGEVLIDGTKINPKEHSKQWGGTGAFVELTRGLHRVEILQTAPGAGPYGTSLGDGGLMYLTWRPPKEQIKNAESRVLNTYEIVRSGDCTLAAVESRDGSPVAVPIARPGLVYWFENEEPLIIYELSALNGGDAAGTTWTWTLPEGATVEGHRIQWLLPGFRESRIKLTGKSAQSASTATLPVFGFSIVATSLEKAEHREAFRSVLATMLDAFPRNPDPVAEWSDAWWNNLLRTVEGGEGGPLLTTLFTDHFDAARKKLTPGQLFTLEDLLLDLSQRRNPQEALQWLQKFAAAASNATARQTELKTREGELQTFCLGDRAQAEKIFTALTTLSGEPGERAKIRLGDLALLGGDLNKATSIYADVQNRARLRRNAGTPAPAGLVANQLVQGGPAQPAAPDWRKSPLALQNPKAPGGFDMKGGALQEVSLSENVRNLTDKNFLLEARQALLVWEIEFPLSKISGDYVIREAELYAKMQDWKRARPMLEAYCREIDASSFLPDAATLLIACVKGANEPPASIRELIEKVKGRLKYHPVASELDRFLSTADKPNP